MNAECRMQNEECRMRNAGSRPPHFVSRFIPGTPVTRHSPLATRHPEKGVALVITLILLAVITFMAITFLVVSTAERGSVTTQTDLNIARLAADTARDRAIVEVLAPLLSTGNEFNYGLLVSTNFINPGGFTSGVYDPLNVNYDYTTAGTPLGANDALLNLANLYYNPRPPVFVVTNSFSGSNEFRYYLDWNRNRIFDPSGLLALTNSLAQPTGEAGWMVGDPQWIGMLQRPEFPHSGTNLFASRYAYFVVPIGQTLDINAVHNFSKFSTRSSMAGAVDGFVRNQGILPSEINLAAFLADLNTNLWPFPYASAAPFGFPPYSYRIDTSSPNSLGFPNSGAAFDDAVGVLTYRYNYNLKSLANVSQLFGPAGSIAFTNTIDAYAAGPLMTGTWWPPVGTGNPNPTRVNQNYPWSGAYNPNAFFSTQDLFDENKTAANIPAGSRPTAWTLTKRLAMASTNTDSYNRDTFARLSAQLGTYSAPEPENKLNLNYRNVDDYGYVVPGMATNFMAWEPTLFFTNVAIRLLVDAGYTVGAPNSTSNLLVTNYTVTGVLVTNLNIQVWPTNLYTPSVHRLLQLAANIYDATTNRTDLGVTDYPLLPSVFRPLFYELPQRNLAGQRQVFIIGYEALRSVNPSGRFDPFVGSLAPHDLSETTDRPVGLRDMVYNVPLVIGAKKGLPSFDQMSMDTKIQIARKLIFHRPGNSTDAPVNEIVPVYLLTITNEVGLQAWNSYSTTYKRRLQMQVWPDVSVMVSNRVTSRLLNPAPQRYPANPTNYYVNGWLGYNPPYVAQQSFVTPLGSPTDYHVFMPTNSVYSFVSDQFTVNGIPDRNPGRTNYAVPRLQVTVKARLRFALVDTTVNQLVDYVNLAANKEVDLAEALQLNEDGSSGCGTRYSPVYSEGAMWCTNVTSPDPMTFGVRLQIDASKGSAANVNWNNSLPDPVYGTDRAKAIARFKAQFFTDPNYPKVNTFGAPFQPFRNIHLVNLWQANDPLVHYTVGDLKNTTDVTNTYYLDRLPSGKAMPPTPYWGVNSRHEPWGGNPVTGSGAATKTDWRLKDSVAGTAGRSDAWDFPTNKLPNVGWLGRVHRGTPWQTIYLKSPGIDFPNWFRWSGNDLMVTNYGQFPWQNMPQFTTVSYAAGTTTNIFQVAYDSAFSQPTNDWRLLDLFTTAIDPNTTRGRLSINQTNLAAWSAVLSGVIALTNSGNGLASPVVIEPAGTYDPAGVWPPLARIVSGINRTRGNTNDPAMPVFPNRVFRRLGDLLSVPELTVASPFLSIPAPPARPNLPLNDAVFERIPQQILGLLKCDPTPRVAIYAFGQTLKPAPRSRVTSGPYFGMVTNYQITAEVATRAIVRFDGVPAYLYGTPSPITNLHPVIESFNILPPD